MPAKPRSWTQARAKWIASALLLSFTCQHSAAFDKPALPRDARPILAAVEKQLAGLDTFSSRVEAQIGLPLLPSLRLTGKVYFKAPHQVKVEVENLPPLVERFRQSFAGLAPRYTRREDYHAELLGDAEVDGVACDKVRLRATQHGSNLQTITLWVSRSEHTIPRTELDYGDGTHVTSTTSFRKVDRYLLPDQQRTVFDMPTFRALAHASYSHYQLNTELPKQLFPAASKP